MDATTTKESTKSAALLQDILDTISPAGVRVSPDGKYVVYSIRFRLNHRKHIDAPAVAALWIAESTVPNSARLFTDGLSSDWMPEWSPDGQSVAFLSTRNNADGASKQAKSCAIYLQHRGSTQPRVVMAPEHNRSFTSISKLGFSPSGAYIAFVAASPSEKSFHESGDDAVVWDQDTNFQHLWLVDVKSGELRILFDGDANVTDFVWCDDRKGDGDLAIMTQRSTHADSQYLHGTTASIVSMGNTEVRPLCHVPRIMWSPVWLHSALYFVGNNISDQDTSGMSIFRVYEAQQVVEKVAHGEVDCAAGLVRADDDIVVHVEHGLEDQLRLLLADITLFSQRKRIVDYHVSGTVQNLHVALSWGDVNTPTELFSLKVGTRDLHKLSEHGRVLSSASPFGHCHFLSCPTLDTKEMLDNLYLVPTQYVVRDDAEHEQPPATPLPTIVIVHGGPYGRRTDAFDAYDPFYLLIQPMLREGYGILVVNYRGGSSRGERFANYARGGMGHFDEPDITASVQHAISHGYADAERLVLGGWSQGGYLAYLSAVRNGGLGLGWRFAGIVAGAGITDWDSMSLTSDVGAGYESQFAGGVPWRMDKNDVRSRSGSALWEFKAAAQIGRIPPMLMLHGERDDRVPISQAWGFQRALDDAGLPFTFVIYPREGHVLRERKHIEDMSERILTFIRKHLGEADVV
ncbi:hypothetical protein SEUCBS140593_005687 [Sporothrix eucalyptigena]|uniref:Dipeptidyl-peptidase V n=1 Tax=Sporothrix eucalyptigena TaxID=1812306 RepID=A0ABP0BYV8_9PEZI